MNLFRFRNLAALSLIAVAAACGGIEPQPGEVAADLEYGSRVHALPLRDSAAAPRAAPAGAHLSYWGGHVVSNASVVQVLYGSGTYLSNITSSTAPSLSSFYQQVMNSPYVDWLSEYNTTVSGGTNQTIGRGGLKQKTQIAPASSRNGATISDVQIQQELSSQIGLGKLPAPTANIIYMVNFPKGKKITQGSSASCVGGGFCAYHGTFKRNGINVYYGVLPDMSPGSGCDLGCGGNTWFNNQTSVASHELIETITDAEVGLATVVGKPLAWYDANNGEIGDICNASQGTITGTDGKTYTVQTEWSNQKNACIVHK
jgi:hypothetical protein